MPWVQELQSVIAELRSDPVLSKLLDKPRIQQAIRDIQQDPGRISRYTGDQEVMAVLTRLMNRGIPDKDMKEFEDLSSSPADMALQMFSNRELAVLLQKPRVRQALAEIRVNPMLAMQKYEQDPEITHVLDLLQQSLGVVDVEVQN